jgi:hypothetical protein
LYLTIPSAVHAARTRRVGLHQQRRIFFFANVVCRLPCPCLLDSSRDDDGDGDGDDL